MKPRPCRIWWRDHFDLGAGSWVPLNDVSKDDVAPAVMETVGWLVRETPDAYVITHTIHRRVRHARGVFVILKANVVRMKEL